MTPEALLGRTYAAFNARDIDGALAALHPDVDWPNGLEGGRVHGHRAVREYWIRQWGLIDPRVEPRGFTTEADGRIAVDVRQVVRDRAGALLKEHDLAGFAEGRLQKFCNSLGGASSSHVNGDFRLTPLELHAQTAQQGVHGFRTLDFEGSGYLCLRGVMSQSRIDSRGGNRST